MKKYTLLQKISEGLKTHTATHVFRKTFVVHLMVKGKTTLCGATPKFIAARARGENKSTDWWVKDLHRFDIPDGHTCKRCAAAAQK